MVSKTNTDFDQNIANEVVGDNMGYVQNPNKYIKMIKVLQFIVFGVSIVGVVMIASYLGSRTDDTVSEVTEASENDYFREFNGEVMLTFQNPPKYADVKDISDFLIGVKGGEVTNVTDKIIMLSPQRDQFTNEGYFLGSAGRPEDIADQMNLSMDNNFRIYQNKVKENTSISGIVSMRPNYFVVVRDGGDVRVKKLSEFAYKDGGIDNIRAAKIIQPKVQGGVFRPSHFLEDQFVLEWEKMSSEQVLAYRLVVEDMFSKRRILKVLDASITKADISDIILENGTQEVGITLTTYFVDGSESSETYTYTS